MPKKWGSGSDEPAVTYSNRMMSPAPSSPGSMPPSMGGMVPPAQQQRSNGYHMDGVHHAREGSEDGSQHTNVWRPEEGEKESWHASSRMPAGRGAYPRDYPASARPRPMSSGMPPQDGGDIHRIVREWANEIPMRPWTSEGSHAQHMLPERYHNTLDGPRIPPPMYSVKDAQHEVGGFAHEPKMMHEGMDMDHRSVLLPAASEAELRYVVRNCVLMDDKPAPPDDGVTIMLRDVPYKLEVDPDLFEILGEDLVHVDYIYLPMTTEGFASSTSAPARNKGYCFLHFSSPGHAERFADRIAQCELPMHLGGGKTMHAALAKFQGLRTNLTNLLDINSKKWRPKYGVAHVRTDVGLSCVSLLALRNIVKGHAKATGSFRPGTSRSPPGQHYIYR